ncbi:MAG: glycosyltransferase, partial [Actinomycetota bacterium]|nr:glycosyltransferase [Actinomycetota bacterium]
MKTGSRVDLHLHSRASGAATSWWVKGLGADVEVQESYTPPEESYQMAKKAGMDFVTLTDHETIEGALTLLHHPDFFIGEEVSTFFPEDGNQVDVLVYGLGAGIHREAQARRKNVYDLVDYLREAGVVHVLAHPIYGIPGDLDRGQVEKRLVLFGLWEFINGSRPARQNHLAREIAEGIGPLELRQLAARHGLPVPPHRKIAGVAGSDDHGGIFGGAAHTVAPKVQSAAEFLEALAAGEVRPAGEDGSVAKFTHTGFRIAGEAIQRGESGRAEGVLQRFALSPSIPGLRRFIRPSPALAGKLLEQIPRLSRLDEPAIRSALVSRYETRLAGALEGMGSGFPLVDFLGSTGDLMDGHLFVAPYVGVHGYFGREKRKAVALRREVFPERPEGLRVGIFVDGLDAIHGVATMYNNIQTLSAEDEGRSLRIVRCGEAPAKNGAADKADGSIHSIRPVTTLPVPLYDGLELGVPSFLDVVDHVAAEDYNVLHVAAPGPLGLAALVAGLTLGIPVVGAYHTEFGAYAGALSGDEMAAEVVEVAVREFYERCAAVAVPSEATALALRNRGYHIRRFEVLRNGVDRKLFNLERRDESMRESLGGGGGAKTLLLYAGRVSREKGLERLAAGYLDLRRRRDDVHLVVAGDGPYRAELEVLLGEAATFTGFLRGEELARTFASCDVFVFPSTTDTLGRAVAEAQASGLPAVVSGIGGPRECIRPGVSGFVIDHGEDERFFARVEELVEDRAKR